MLEKIGQLTSSWQGNGHKKVIYLKRKAKKRTSAAAHFEAGTGMHRKMTITEMINQSRKTLTRNGKENQKVAVLLKVCRQKC